MGESWLGLGTQHVVTRSVRDSAAVLDLTCGYMAGDPYVAPPPLGSYLSEVTSPPEKLRIGFSQVRVNGEHFPKETLAALNSTAKLLESLGHTIEEESPTYDRSLVGEIMGVASAYALTELVSARQRETGIEPSEHNLELANVMSLAKGRALTTSDLMQTYKKINTVARAFASFFDAFDIWLTPTMSDVAPPLGYLDSSSPDVDLLISRFSELYQFNSVYNISGLPAITLPLHSSTDGMPIGVMFGAGFGKEATLFRLSGQLERAKPWRKRHPKISC
jgi:amidase